MKKKSMDACIADGVAILNKRNASWHTNVDWKHLNMSNENGLIEQLFGGYKEGLDILGLTFSQAQCYGFDIAVPEEEELALEKNRKRWSALTAAWKKVGSTL